MSGNITSQTAPESQDGFFRKAFDVAASSAYGLGTVGTRAATVTAMLLGAMVIDAATGGNLMSLLDQSPAIVEGVQSLLPLTVVFASAGLGLGGIGQVIDHASEAILGPRSINPASEIAAAARPAELRL